MSTATEEKTIDHILLDENVVRRQEFINLMMPNGKLPDDPKDKALILKAIDGIDKTAVSRLRIKQEDKTNVSNEKIAMLLAGVYKGVSATKNPYVVQDMKDITPENTGVIPTIPDHLRTINLVEGETSINPRQLSYKEFTEGTPLPAAATEE